MPGKFINEITGDVPAKDDLAVFFDKSKNSTAQATIAEIVNAGLDLAAGAKGQVPTIDVKVDAATSSLVNILTWGAGGGVDFKGTPTRPPAATDEILTNDPVNGLVGKTTVQQLLVAGGATILQPGTAVNTALAWNDTAGKWEPARAVSEAKNINGGATGELPFQLNTHVTAWLPLGNAGQVLTVGDIGAAGSPFIAPMWSDPVKELPAFTIADKGKQLTVKADGKATEWVEDAKELPTITDGGKLLAAKADKSGVEWIAKELPTITAGLTALQTKADKSGVEWVTSVNQATNLKGGFTAGAFFPVNDTKTDTTRFVNAHDFRTLAGISEPTYFPNWTPVNDQVGPGWNDMGVALAKMTAIFNSDPLAGTGSVTKSGTFPGNYKYSNAVLMSDGKVFITPNRNDQAIVYDPIIGSVSLVGTAGDFPTSAHSFGYGVLLNDGRVFCIPRESTQAKIFNPKTGLVSNAGPAGAFPSAYNNPMFAGGVLLPSGKVFCVPINATQARVYDPVTDTVSLAGAANSFPGGGAYNGGVLLPSGKVFCVPSNATQARVYDPVTDTVSLVGAANSFPGGAAYSGGVLLPGGKVFCVPYSATQAAIVDFSSAQLGLLQPNFYLSPFYNKSL
jgi:hypothetical protein